jgi:hypothetical protein
MTQFYSRNDTTFNGDVYSIPFSYIKENEINVFINDKLYNEWEFLNESQIKLTQTPTNLPDNSIVSIRRITDITEKIVNYKNNTILSKEPLNLAQAQLLNAIQEIYDDNTAFKTNINTTIIEVTEAANKINQLEESVNRATEASTKAQEAVLLANTKMEQTTQKIEEMENKTEQIEANSEQIATINQAILTKATTSLNNLTADGEARFDCKVNTDGSNLTNVSNAFKAKIVNWGIPDYDSRINTGKQTPYTAPCDGLFVYSNNSTDSYMGSASVNGFLVSTLRAYTTDCFPVAKNDVITLANTPQITTTYFVPMKGEINTNV